MAVEMIQIFKILQMSLDIVELCWASKVHRLEIQTLACDQENQFCDTRILSLGLEGPVSQDLK